MSVPLATPETDLDERTKAELQPPCEVRVWLVLGGLCVDVSMPCDRPASWIVRFRCQCAVTYTLLVCDPCNTETGWICRGCNCVDSFVQMTREPLR